MRSQSSSVMSAAGVLGCSTPALLKAMSMRPNASVGRCSAAWIASLLVTSQPTASAVPPSASIDATVSRPCSSVRSAATTLAPSRANAIAVARPMPLPAPVTKATLPAKRPFRGHGVVLTSLVWAIEWLGWAIRW